MNSQGQLSLPLLLRLVQDTFTTMIEDNLYRIAGSETPFRIKDFSALHIVIDIVTW